MGVESFYNKKKNVGGSSESLLEILAVRGERDREPGEKCRLKSFTKI
jgi:hypothetical protein